MMTAFRRKVFISYARADSDFVDELLAVLRKNGYQPWFDKEDIAPGDPFRAEIRAAIHACDAFLMVVSKNSAGRDGVLAGEWREAQQILSDRLDKAYLIPILTDETALPEEVAHLQAIDARGEDRWTAVEVGMRRRLRKQNARMLRRAFMAAGVALVCGATYGGYRWQARASVEKSYQLAMSQRPGAPNPSPASGDVHLGVTLWEVRAQTEGARCENLQFIRIPLDASLEWGAHVRLTLEPSQRGYLYVVNEELLEGGQRRNANLIYPSNVMNPGVRPLSPGRLIEIPPSIGEFCPTFQLNKSGSEHQGEAVALIFSDTPIPELAPGPDTSRPIADSTMRDLRGRAVTSLETATWNADVWKPRSPAETDAARLNGERSLDFFDPRPQALFSVAAVQRPILVNVNLMPRR